MNLRDAIAMQLRDAVHGGADEWREADAILALVDVMTADELIVLMLDHASNAQSDTIDDVLVACGYWWECDPAHGYQVHDQPCDWCGAVAPNQPPTQKEPT